MAASSTSPGPRARASHLGPERRRPQVLDVAFKLFLERGYKGTSMDAIADAAGVTKPVVYACFASKAELFGALVDREEQRMFAQLGAALATGAQSANLETMLVTGFTAMLRAAGDTPEIYRVALLDDGDAGGLIDTRIRRGRARMVGQLTEMSRAWLDGKVPPRAVERTAQFAAETLVGVGDAGLRMMLAAPDRWTPEALGRALGQFAAAGYAAAGEAAFTEKR
ncbi:MAG TPA: helix-turn-helix domain-containing protein [Solirubrobacteraceae bacterium]|jgi:AcrR family transcriptional regulator|nr:helix-turn-helix domain-containing protein [Solirubrobacteraceae bacterium]